MDTPINNNVHFCGECQFHGIHSTPFFGFAWFVCKKKRAKQRKTRVPLDALACEKFTRSTPDNVCVYRVR